MENKNKKTTFMEVFLNCYNNHYSIDKNMQI